MVCADLLKAFIIPITPLFEKYHAKKKPSDNHSPLCLLTISVIVSSRKPKTCKGSISPNAFIIASCSPSTGIYGISVKRKRIPGNKASKKVNDKELALDISELFRIPIIKNFTTS
jgi:hypothetical protein